jgi:hypothetical protein
LLVAAVVLAIWRWSSLGWHARGIVLAAFGAAAMLAVMIPALRIRAILHSGNRAQGIVVDVEESGGGPDDEIPDYRPVVRFTTAEGRTVEFTGSIGYDGADLSVA